MYMSILRKNYEERHKYIVKGFNRVIKDTVILTDGILYLIILANIILKMIII